jgi:hypothetical protein
MLLGFGGVVDTRAIVLALGASCFAALASVAQRRVTAPAPGDLSLSVRLISYLVKRQRDSMMFTVDTHYHVLPDFLVRPSPPYGPAASGVGMPPVIVDDPSGLAEAFSIAAGVKTVSYVIDGEMYHDTRSTAPAISTKQTSNTRHQGSNSAPPVDNGSASTGDAAVNVKEK